MNAPLPAETIPRRSWFLLQPPSDLHGLGHTARVMVWASVLTRGLEWWEPVVWAAVCHDLRRRDDGLDPRHGFRAGSWVRERLPGKLRRSPGQLDLIAQACDWHVCDDLLAKWDHPVLWYLKDADGLDRVRLYDLDPAYLRHKETRRWIQKAEALYAATQDEENPVQIWRTAQKQGLPVEELLAFVARQGENVVKTSKKEIPGAEAEGEPSC